MGGSAINMQLWTSLVGTHLLDALAQGPEFWQRGLDQRAVIDNEEAVLSIMQDRDILTGY